MTKYIFILLFIILASEKSVGQLQLAQEHEVRADLLSSMDEELLSEYVNNENRDVLLKKAITTINSDKTSDAVKAILLGIYLQEKYLLDVKLLNWTLDNIDFTIDRNVYEFPGGMSKPKHPILHFLVELDNSTIFNIEDLLDSSLINDCDFFEETYNREYTCRLLLEYMMSNGERMSTNNTRDFDNTCQKKNYLFIMKNWCRN